MKRVSGFSRLHIVLFALIALAAVLACSTLTSRLPSQARTETTEAPQQAGPETTQTPARPPATEATPRGRATESGAATATPLVLSEGAVQIEGGPIVGPPRETRVAVSEQVPLLDQLTAEDYSEEELAEVGRTFNYTVELDEEQRLIWSYGWCATTPEILEQNFEHMTLEFAANGQPVDVSQFEVIDGQVEELVCRFHAAVVYAWPSGATTIETRVIFEEQINDGLGDYPAGEQSFVYLVTAP